MTGVGKTGRDAGDQDEEDNQVAWVVR